MSNIRLESIDEMFYEENDVSVISALEGDENHLPEEIVSDADRTWIETSFRVNSERERDVYELHREENTWLMYEEIMENSKAFSPTPFPDI